MHNRYSMNFLKLLTKKGRAQMSGGNQDPRLWPGSFFNQTLFQRFLNPTSSNINITSESAFQVPAYWLAVRAISEDIAKLPINLFTVNRDGTKKIIFNNPLQKVLKQGFNDETDSFTGIQTLVQWMLTFGNGYAEIQRNSLGDIRLNLIHPSRVSVQRNGAGDLVYIVTTRTEMDAQNKRKQRTTSFTARDMLHLKGPGNGVVGYSIGEIAAQSLGISVAAQDFTGAFFGNNLSIGAALETDKALDAPQKEAIRKDWKKKFGGSKNAGEMAILDRGFKFNRLQMSSTDAELLATREFQIKDIARWFRIPPHKLMDMSNSTFNNVEQQDINYSTDTITPWIRRLEVQLKFKFHRTDNTIIDIDEKALARGDMKARSAFFKEMFAMGVMDGNQIALAEGLPEYEGGELRYIPMNLTPITQGLESAELDNEAKRKALEAPEPITEPVKEEDPEPEPEPQEEPAPIEEEQPAGITEQVAIAAYLPTMKDSFSRLTRKESLTHEAAAKKDSTAQLEHLNKFYAKFESELADCLELHANYLCNILNKEKFTSDKLMFMSQEICQLEKSDGQSDIIVEKILTEVAGMEESPQLKDVKQDEDGNHYIFTMSGWSPVDVI